MSAKYAKIKGNLIKQESIDTSKIKNKTILEEDIAFKLTGDIFLNNSIPAIKLSDEVTKQGNLFNIPNKLVQLDQNGKIPFHLLPEIKEKLKTIDLIDVEGNINAPNGLVKLNNLGRINSNLIDLNDLLYKKIDSSYLLDDNKLVKYDNNLGISSENIRLKKIYLYKSSDPEIIDDEVIIYYDENTNKILLKTQDGVKEIGDNIRFISSEKPEGEANGQNTIFMLKKVPIMNSERIYINGLREIKENYIIQGKKVIFNEPPFPDAQIRVDYCYLI